MFATSEEWAGNPSVKRSAIRLAEYAELPDVGRWLFEQARGAGRSNVADSILHLFGETDCPPCEAHVSLVDAIAACDED